MATLEDSAGLGCATWQPGPDQRFGSFLGVCSLEAEVVAGGKCDRHEARSDQVSQPSGDEMQESR
jgi:hypothetical protein